MYCPHCQGTNVQRLKVIYEAGVTEVTARHELVGVPGTVVHTRQANHTLLAQRVAPPERVNAAPAGWPLVIGGLLLYDAWRTPRFGPVEKMEALVGAVALVIGYLMAQYYGRLNDKVAKDYQVWLRSWYCNQCGSLFIQQ